MRFPRAVAAFTAAAVVLGACASDESTTSPTTTTGPSPTTPSTEPLSRVDYEPVFTEGPCSVALPPSTRLTCGTLQVPEDRTIEDGNTVDLAVVRIHYDGADPRPEPVVYLHGGPGAGTLSSGVAARAEFGRQMRRDLIVFDQRGAGLSTPNLNCPERENAFVDALASTAGWTAEFAELRQATAACYTRLSDAGIDLSQYNTRTNAADVEDLRRALDIDTWNLWGISYGSRVGLEVLRAYPAGVRAVVLDSVYPPSVAKVQALVESGTEAFDRMSSDCGTEPTCEERYGDLSAALDSAITSMNDAPFSVDIAGADGTERTLVLNGGDMAAGLFTAMYDTNLIPMLPSVIADIANGGRSIVPMIAEIGIPSINSITEGAFLSFECADNGARANREEIDALIADPGIASTILLAGWQLFCDDWPVAPLPTSFGAPVTSDIPALVFGGEYDPVTPVKNSQDAAESLANATFVMVPRAGHGVGRTSGCTTGLFIKFLDDPEVADTSCVSGIPVVPFR